MMVNPGHIAKEEPYQRLRVRDTLPSLLAEVKRTVERLWSALKVLPPVKEDGSSACPFASDLYHGKEKAARELQMRRSTLQEYQEAVERESGKRSRERERIAADARKAVLPETRDSYREALSAQTGRCDETARQRQSIVEMMAEVDRVLGEAAMKKWPLGEPRSGAAAGTAPHETGGYTGTGNEAVVPNKFGGAGSVPPKAARSFGPEIDGLMRGFQATRPPWGGAGSK